MIVFLSSCAKVPIHDAEWCGDIGDLGASCFHTLTNDTRDIDKSMWDVERFGMVCTKSKTFSDMKASIEKLCSVSSVRCSYEVKQILAHVQENIKELQALTAK